jgi:pyruvate kinase
MKEKTDALFGACHQNGIPCLMVTFDTTHAQNFYAVKNLLQSGMNIARINCAHDNEEVWQQMIDHVKKASLQTGQPCKIFMDLPGPKIRTRVKGNKKGKEKLPVALGQHIYLTDSESTDDALLPTVTCTLPGIIRQLHISDRVLFDDGLIEAKVVDKTELKAQLQVVRISSKKPFIKSEKGINFPDTRFFFSALTDYDRQCLPFIQKHADMVGYSFVRTVADLLQLQEAMVGQMIPVVLKIETPEAVKNLPALLLQGMQQALLGVMIARGDLAVEIGFERMSEVQEEILWICEAGHVPVIWATQVLESLNKSAVATRSEITDAAHAAMAECVMINKGEHTLQVIDMLKDILQRSGGHHVKKRYLFRPLSMATRFIAH